MKKIEGTDVQLGELTQEKLDSLEKKYIKKEDGFYCSMCNNLIMQTTIYISIYAKETRQHAGFGKVKHAPYPYCPKCEGKPKNVSAYIRESIFS